MAVPADHPIRAYCQDAGITDEMRQIAWLVFRDRHMTAERTKRQKDWPAAFANSVKGRWYKLWFVNESGAAEWTATGLQEKRVLDARHAAAAAKQEAEHAPA